MRWVAIGRQLRHCPEVYTLGVRPTFDDYAPTERDLLLSGRKIYFPTLRFVDLFRNLGIPTYPGWQSYSYLGNKFRQTNLFQALGLPVPRTRCYFGRRRTEGIRNDFTFPFIAKIGRGSSQGAGVYLIRSEADLAAYLEEARNLAYIQEYLPVMRDIRVVVVGGEAVHAYWRVAPEGSHLTNLAQGGRIEHEGVPQEAVALARVAAVRCGFDEAGWDIVETDGGYLILEANMIFGTEGLEAAGIRLPDVRRRFLLSGKI